MIRHNLKCYFLNNNGEINLLLELKQLLILDDTCHLSERFQFILFFSFQKTLHCKSLFVHAQNTRDTSVLLAYNSGGSFELRMTIHFIYISTL